MGTNTDESLDLAVGTLARLTELARVHGMHDSAHFLAMARTQLLMDLNGVSDIEFRALCNWLEGKRPPPGARRGSAQGRGRRDSQLRAMQRAWLSPQDASAGRGRRRAAVTGQT